ncbi:hypothetical protein OC842_006188 [Tilletia horrida]|uniref:Uncharacterized protein n=1 Tax=Tilletia horrida TaxID=155126 RepID=A0AAN6G6I6_9BASI|nr:hypothetical protein OC842_006188 [Tilletia horrida]
MPVRQEEERLVRQLNLVPAHDRLRIDHYGRYTLGDLAVRAIRAELVDGRRSAEVEANVDGNMRFFQIVHFTMVRTGSRKIFFAFARPFLPAHERRSFTVGTWAATHELVPLGAIKQVVAGLVLNQRVYVVRRGTWSTESEAQNEEPENEAEGALLDGIES